MESLWRSGRAIGRGIRRLQVQFHMEDQNFLSEPLSRQEEKNKFLPVMPLSRSPRARFFLRSPKKRKKNDTRFASYVVAHFPQEANLKTLSC